MTLKGSNIRPFQGRGHINEPVPWALPTAIEFHPYRGEAGQHLSLGLSVSFRVEHDFLTEHYSSLT